ncbi:hypothetical protein SAMN05421504_103827 [Amycolatopsis xylanica]|uniref:Uncharacterized protein n=1 Tax=Amycolatopsis xylanica TaxID=589385 RepID=A0A1H3EHH0_9PSEU|nr:hypothetical protein [Amycolatopsis xylanica]SDX78203.1 hypothetical protein SAMN05421504_103827 [Amycolatopsis xylanica]
MSGPYGYAQQQGPPAPQRRPSGATAILAGLLGLLVAGAIAYLPIRVFISLPSGFSIGDLDTRALIYIGVALTAAFCLLLGSLMTFFRAFAGAIVLIVGSLLAIAAILLEATLYLSFGEYFSAVFSFSLTEDIVRAAAVIGAPLVLLLAVLPPTFKYLRFRPSAPQVYGQPPAYNPQGW